MRKVPEVPEDSILAGGYKDFQYNRAVQIPHVRLYDVIQYNLIVAQL